MKRIFLIIVALSLSSCIPPNESTIQTAIARTQTAEFIRQATLSYEAQIRVNQQNTQIAQTVAAMPTSTPKNTPTPKHTATPTRTPIPPKLITATAVQATKQYIAGFSTIAWKELKGYPDNHSGEKIKIKGELFQIIGGIDMLLWYPGTYDAFYVSFLKPYTGVYEDDILTIFGNVIGEFCYDTRSGGSNCVPKIQGYWFQK